jgi:hypothetical protein
MKEDVEAFIKEFEKCQKNKMTQYQTRKPLTITDTPSVVFAKCIVDIVGPISPSNEGNRYILTVQDDFPKIFNSCTPETTDSRGSSQGICRKLCFDIRTTTGSFI